MPEARRRRTPEPLLTSIRLENFKVFADSHSVTLKPITILVGKNSAGKSSLLKAILASSQTVRQPPPSGFSDFRLIGDLTNLGTFSDTIHGGATNQRFTLTFGLVGPDDRDLRPEIRDRLKGKTYSFRYMFSRSKTSPLDAKFSGVRVLFDDIFVCSGSRYAKNKPSKNSTHWRPHTKRCIGVKTLKTPFFPLGESTAKEPTPEEIPDNPVMSEMRKAFQKIMKDQLDADGDKSTKYHLYVNDFEIDVVHPSGLRFMSTHDEAFKYFLHSEQASRKLQNVLRRIIYIAPLRDEPAREARLAQSTDNSVGNRGENLPTMLHRRKDNEKFMETFNGHLKGLGIAESASTSASYIKGENGEELPTGYINLTVNKDGIPRSLMDLGFGTSQALPIVFELSLRKNRLILLEQPELHLHPAAQSEIGDLLKFSMDQ